MSNPKFPVIRHSNAPRHVASPAVFRNLQPGETRQQVCDIWPDAIVRYRKLILHLKVEAPDIRLYTIAHKVGGSKRRGQLASQHWASDGLRHLKGRWEADVRLANITIGTLGHIIGEGPPAAMFNLNQVDLDLVLSVRKARQQVSLTFTNGDTRVVNINASLMGQLL